MCREVWGVRAELHWVTGSVTEERERDCKGTTEVTEKGSVITSLGNDCVINLRQKWTVMAANSVMCQPSGCTSSRPEHRPHQGTDQDLLTPRLQTNVLTRQVRAAWERERGEVSKSRVCVCVGKSSAGSIYHVISASDRIDKPEQGDVCRLMHCKNKWDHTLTKFVAVKVHIRCCVCPEFQCPSIWLFIVFGGLSLPHWILHFLCLRFIFFSHLFQFVLKLAMKFENVTQLGLIFWITTL